MRWQESLNPRGIALGLERVREVATRMALPPFACPVITVAGTNGKGSCVAFLESILRAQGYQTGVYTSPHLLRYNERVRVAGKEVADDVLCAAFEQVEAQRGRVPLTYFEFGTLAALSILQAAEPQAVVLEVGLGGRLDAVNLVDADLALISSIGLDHTDWLGADRESIGSEKAGIFRPRQLAVCGDPDPPRSLQMRAEQLGVRLYCLNREFSCQVSPNGDNWSWQGWDERLDDLPPLALKGQAQRQNAATSLATLKLLQQPLPLSRHAIQDGLRKASLPGRFQELPGPIPIILDVAHNAEAFTALARNLESQACTGRTLAVLGMLRDKPAGEAARAMDAQVHAWYLGGLQVEGRAQTVETLVQRLGSTKGERFCYTDIPTAFDAARRAACPGDRVVVFGSFHTVEAVLRMAA